MSGRLGQARKSQSNFLNTSKYHQVQAQLENVADFTSGFVHFGIPRAVFWGWQLGRYLVAIFICCTK
jgi:uncharacterized membrane protein YjdF